MAADQRTGFEARLVVDVVDDAVDKFLRKSGYDGGRRSTGPVRLDRLKMFSGHPAISQGLCTCLQPHMHINPSPLVRSKTGAGAEQYFAYPSHSKQRR